MNRCILKDFLYDYKETTFFYFLNTILISIFYSLKQGKREEIIYPFLIAAFLYSIYLVLNFYHYYNNSRIREELTVSPQTERGSKDKVNSRWKSAFIMVHSNYMNQINNLKRNNREHERVLSAWIHNMKTPIAVCSLLLERYSHGDVEVTELVQGTKEENEKLLKELNAILDILRLEEFQKDYQPEEIDLSMQLKEIINDLKRQFIYNKVYPKMIRNDENCIVLSDTKWNAVMIKQFISNAIKYSRETEKIEFSIMKQKHRVVLEIKDYGIGIPEYDLPKVFEAFFTGDNGRKESSSSGIGLYLCKEIADMLGHHLKLTSEEKKGTTIQISYLTRM